MTLKGLPDKSIQQSTLKAFETGIYHIPITKDKLQDIDYFLNKLEKDHPEVINQRGYKLLRQILML